MLGDRRGAKGRRRIVGELGGRAAEELRLPRTTSSTLMVPLFCESNMRKQN